MPTHWCKQRLQGGILVEVREDSGGMWPPSQAWQQTYFSQVEGPGGRKENVRPLVPQASVRELGKMTGAAVGRTQSTQLEGGTRCCLSSGKVPLPAA